jgi:hypothetical protein
VPLELEAVDAALHDLHLDIRVVLLAERRYEQLGPERRAEVLLEKFPRVSRPEAREIGVGDLRPVASDAGSLSDVVLLHVEQDVAEHRSGQTLTDSPAVDRARRPRFLIGHSSERRQVRQSRDRIVNREV